MPLPPIRSAPPDAGIVPRPASRRPSRRSHTDARPRQPTSSPDAPTRGAARPAPKPQSAPRRYPPPEWTSTRLSAYSVTAAPERSLTTTVRQPPSRTAAPTPPPSSPTTDQATPNPQPSPNRSPHRNSTPTRTGRRAHVAPETVPAFPRPDESATSPRTRVKPKRRHQAGRRRRGLLRGDDATSRPRGRRRCRPRPRL